MLVLAGNTEADYDPVEEAGPGEIQAAAGKIITGVENQFILAPAELLVLQQRPIATPVAIGRDPAKMLALVADPKQVDHHSSAGPAIGGIQYMSGQTSHGAPVFMPFRLF
jgi:hypothetical protein